MAKFNFKKWVTENKHGLLNEQSNVYYSADAGGYITSDSEPGTIYVLGGCNENHSKQNCIPNSFFGGSPAPVGHTLTIGLPPQPGNQGGIMDVSVLNVVGSCVWYEASNSYPINLPTAAQINPGPLASCPNNPNAIISDPDPVDPVDPDTGEEEGSFGTGGNYTVFDYPPAFNVTQWTTSFIDMIINHPNPCNFLTQRITQFNNQLSAGVGPLQANLLMQKMAVCQELYQMVGCGGMNEQISGIKRYQLDPKAAAVIKKMAPKLRGLASKGRGVKKESKKIGALKRIVKETLLKLKNKKRKNELASNRFRKAVLTKPKKKMN